MSIFPRVIFNGVHHHGAASPAERRTRFQIPISDGRAKTFGLRHADVYVGSRERGLLVEREWLSGSSRVRSCNKHASVAELHDESAHELHRDVVTNTIC